MRLLTGETDETGRQKYRIHQVVGEYLKIYYSGYSLPQASIAPRVMVITISSTRDET